MVPAGRLIQVARLVPGVVVIEAVPAIWVFGVDRGYCCPIPSEAVLRAHFQLRGA